MKRLIVALVLCCMIAPQAGFAARKKPSTPKEAQNPDNRKWSEELLKLHNQQRKDRLIKPLKINEKLTVAAQKYAELLAKEEKLDHNLHSTLADRVKVVGYNWSTLGENIAEGQPKPEVVVDDWMHSEGHKKNILNDSFEEVGFGYAQAKDGRWYWVTDFGTGR